MTLRSIGALLGAACVALATVGPVQAQPSARSRDSDLATVGEILQSPEADIDLAKAKVTIDRLIDPSIDAAATLAQLDGMAKGLKAVLPAGVSKRLTMDALRYHLYKASPWNDNRPFQYDLDDPFGANVRNKLLSTYLATRKGNCVSMPLLFIILGQKLGIDVTASTAPNHVFVKYRDDDGTLHNLETTSGAGFTRDVWMRQQFPMSDEALASGIYMRALTKRESVVVMVGTLLEFYGQQGLQQQRIAMAKLALEHDPKHVSAILHQHSAYLWFMNLIINQHLTPDDMPANRRAQVMRLQANMKALYEQAYALGWRPLDEASEEQYRKTIMRARASQQP